MGDDTVKADAPKLDNAATKDIDPSLYSWGSFFSILKGQANQQDVDRYFAARDIVREEKDCQKCKKNVAWLLQNSPTVQFLREKAQALGHDINESNIHCLRCPDSRGGGFDPDFGILLCANYRRSRSDVEDSLSHEMIHAYDFLRFKYDHNNLRHAACSEIRASALSGECRFTNEFFSKFHFKFSKQFQNCVRRRATLSMLGRKACKDNDRAAGLVDEVWDSCFPDTRPFDERYR